MERKIIDYRNIEADPLKYIIHFQNEVSIEFTEREQKEVLIKLTNAGLRETREEQISHLIEIMKEYANVIV